MKRLPVAFAFVTLIILTISSALGVFGDKAVEKKTEKQIVMDMMESIIFQKPKSIRILYRNHEVDKKTRIEYETIVFKTNEEFQPRSSKIDDSNEHALEKLRESLPDYDFGTPAEDKAAFARLITPTAEWTISSIHTDLGHFSTWVRKADVFQLRRGE